MGDRKVRIARTDIGDGIMEITYNDGKRSHCSGVCVAKELPNKVYPAKDAQFIKFVSVELDQIVPALDPTNIECWIECVAMTPNSGGTWGRTHLSINEDFTIALSVKWGDKDLNIPTGTTVVCHVLLDQASWKTVKTELQEQLSKIG